MAHMRAEDPAVFEELFVEASIPHEIFAEVANFFTTASAFSHSCPDRETLDMFLQELLVTQRHGHAQGVTGGNVRWHPLVGQIRKAWTEASKLSQPNAAGSSGQGTAAVQFELGVTPPPPKLDDGVKDLQRRAFAMDYLRGLDRAEYSW
jgi:hypothetical protein